MKEEKVTEGCEKIIRKKSNTEKMKSGGIGGTGRKVRKRVR